MSVMGNEEESTFRKRGLLGVKFLLNVGIVCGLLSMLGVVGPRTDVRPPSDLETLAQFYDWKSGGVRGEGIFSHDGVEYKVLLGERAHWMSSGFSAYIFDDAGKFVDWTSDMGDVPSVKHGFRLMSGKVEKLKVYDVKTK